MSEDLYAKPDLAKKVRFQAGVKKDGNTDLGENIDNVTIYDNFWAEGSTAPKSEDNTSDHQQPSAGDVKRSPCRAAAVILGLLCLLLLTGLVTLVVIYTKGISEWKMEMVLARIRYNNLTEERDQLQTSYNKLTEEQRQLQNRFDDVAKERKHFHRMLQSYEWSSFSGSFYYISSETKSWWASRVDCKNKSADLVIINSRVEQNFIISFQKVAWIGLRDSETEGTWKWVNGTPLTTSYWADGEPNAATVYENCAQLKHFQPEKSWNDVPCDQKLLWICEKTSTW